MEGGVIDEEYLYNALGGRSLYYTKLPTGRRMAIVTYEWTTTTLSYLRVDAWPKSPTVNGHYTKLPMGRSVAKVAYGWTVITLSHLQVDA